MEDSPAARSERVYVWDPLVRIGHWMLVATVALAWLTRHGGGIWHEVLGYAALAIVGLRLVWGIIGSTYARFSNFIVSPGNTLAYAARMLRGTEPRYIGHNPLGGWMIIAVITVVILVGFSGWLYTTDRYWGIEWVETLHRQLSNLLLALVALHIGGVLLAPGEPDRSDVAWSQTKVTGTRRGVAAIRRSDVGRFTTPVSLQAELAACAA